MKVRLVVNIEVESLHTLYDLVTALNNVLPYMGDNVEIEAWKIFRSSVDPQGGGTEEAGKLSLPTETERRPSTQLTGGEWS